MFPTIKKLTDLADYSFAKTQWATASSKRWEIMAWLNWPVFLIGSDICVQGYSGRMPTTASTRGVAVDYDVYRTVHAMWGSDKDRLLSLQYMYSIFALYCWWKASNLRTCPCGEKCSEQLAFFPRHFFFKKKSALGKVDKLHKRRKCSVCDCHRRVHALVHVLKAAFRTCIIGFLHVSDGLISAAASCCWLTDPPVCGCCDESGLGMKRLASSDSLCQQRTTV